MDGLIALLIFLNNPNAWKDQVYKDEYNKAIIRHLSEEKVLQKETKIEPKTESGSTISWYATGTKGNYTACWKEFRGKKIRVTYQGKSIVVTCNDTGDFRRMGRELDLSDSAFAQLAPLSRGIIRGAKVEVLP